MNITIKTLTPVHIGSGIEYSGNAGYLYFEQERTVALIDEAKILDIIGVENLHIWINFIEHRADNFLSYLRQLRPQLKPEEVSLRIMPLKGNLTPMFSNTLREHIHGGLGRPYLPGSSLKGAIRTAVLADRLMGLFRDNGITSEYLINKQSRIKDTVLQQKIFGNDPNSDWFRMLQVGDCYFPEGCTHTAFAETLNNTSKTIFGIKKEVRQFIEYLPSGLESDCTITIPQKHLELIQSTMPNLFKIHEKQLDLNQLLGLVHVHSLRLLKNEIRFFEDAELPEENEALMEFLQEMEIKARSFQPNEYLVRLGFGTGYRNMTGDWVADLVLDDNCYDDIATATRRTNRYNNMPLPKSRKLMFDDVFMGYIKITLK